MQGAQLFLFQRNCSQPSPTPTTGLQCPTEVAQDLVTQGATACSNPPTPCGSERRVRLLLLLLVPPSLVPPPWTKNAGWAGDSDPPPVYGDGPSLLSPAWPHPGALEPHLIAHVRNFGQNCVDLDAILLPTWAVLAASWPHLGPPGGSKRNTYHGFWTAFQFRQIPLNTCQQALTKPQEAPRGSQEALKKPQDGPKRVPRWPQEAPRGPQDDPNRGPRRPHDCPRRPPTHPRASKRPQDAPETPKVHPQKAPRASHKGPEKPQEA